MIRDQEAKKKQIAEYKQQKMEAEEMLANADLPEFDDYGEVGVDDYDSGPGVENVLDNSYMKMK